MILIYHLLIMAEAALASSARQDPVCQKGGFCSIGKTQPASGDMHLPGVLLTALQKVAYKNEVIALSATGDHMENAVSFFLHLRYNTALCLASLLMTHSTFSGSEGMNMSCLSRCRRRTVWLGHETCTGRQGAFGPLHPCLTTLN